MAIELYQFKAGRSVPNFSPFCMKASILLKMADVQYDEKIISNPANAPHGKLPYIIDDGNIIADTALIKKHIEARYNIDFDARLSAEQKATSHAYATMIEERLYFALVYSRWIDERNWPSIKDFWFSSLPPLIRNIVPIIAQRQTRARLNAQGLGKHDPSDIYAFAAQDLSALSVYLGDKNFMCGDHPTSLDASAYPIIANSCLEEFNGPLGEAASAHDNFKRYIDRCQKLWFE